MGKTQCNIAIILFLKNTLFLSVVELEVFSEMELASHLTSVNQKEAQLLDLVRQGRLKTVIVQAL